MSVVITVRGSFTDFRPPERATVRVSLAVEAATSKAAYAGAARSATVVSDGLTELHNPDSGPVTWWSSDQIRTWANRPWNNEGKQLPLVHRANVTFAAKFSDFDRLSAWVAQTAEVKGATVERIEWALTAEHLESLTREVRTGAVRDARDKAQSYADALSLGSTRVVALADAGMLDHGLVESPAPQRFSLRATAGQEGPQVGFAPEDVEISVAVDARFEVDALQ